MDYLKEVNSDGKNFKALNGVVLEKYGRYIQGNYIDEVAWSEGWPSEVRKWRGHIYDIPSKSIVARPMDKFFKYEDIPEVNKEYVLNLFENANIITKSRKLDGTLIIAWYDRFGSGSWRLSTRGMIDFKQELDDTVINFHQIANKYLVDNSLFFKYVYTPGNEWINDYTLCFELVDTNNRIVTKYNKEDNGMYLLSIRHTRNGEEVNPYKVRNMANIFQVKYPELETLEGTSSQLLKLLEDKKNSKTNNIEEGVVLRFDTADSTGRNTIRVKFINDQYLENKWIYKAASERFFFNAYRSGDLENIYDVLPDELKIRVDNFYRVLEAFHERIEQAVASIPKVLTPGTKIASDYIMENFNNELSYYIHASHRGVKDFKHRLRRKHLRADIYKYD